MGDDGEDTGGGVHELEMERRGVDMAGSCLISNWGGSVIDGCMKERWLVKNLYISNRICCMPRGHVLGFLGPRAVGD